MPDESDRVINMAVSDPNERRWVGKIRGTSVRVLRREATAEITQEIVEIDNPGREYDGAIGEWLGYHAIRGSTL